MEAPKNANNKNMFEQTSHNIYDATKSQDERNADEYAQKTFTDNFKENKDSAIESYKMIGTKEQEEEPAKTNLVKATQDGFSNTGEKIHEVVKTDAQREEENKDTNDAFSTQLVDGACEFADTDFLQATSEVLTSKELFPTSEFMDLDTIPTGDEEQEEENIFEKTVKGTKSEIHHTRERIYNATKSVEDKKADEDAQQSLQEKFSDFLHSAEESKAKRREEFDSLVKPFAEMTGTKTEEEPVETNSLADNVQACHNGLSNAHEQIHVAARTDETREAEKHKKEKVREGIWDTADAVTQPIDDTFDFAISKIKDMRPSDENKKEENKKIDT
jgi:hypothetical protein